MPEYIGEHSLALECVWKMNYYPTPLVGQNFIRIWVISALIYRLTAEINESLLDRFRVAPIGELSIENRGILVYHYLLILKYHFVLLLGAREELEDLFC